MVTDMIDLTVEDVHSASATGNGAGMRRKRKDQQQQQHKRSCKQMDHQQQQQSNSFIIDLTVSSEPSPQKAASVDHSVGQMGGQGGAWSRLSMSTVEDQLSSSEVERGDKVGDGGVDVTAHTKAEAQVGCWEQEQAPGGSSCNMCSKDSNLADDKQSKMVLLHCGHVSCVGCLRRSHATDTGASKSASNADHGVDSKPAQRGKCACGVDLTEQDLRKFLCQDEVNAVLEHLLFAMLEKDSTFVRCPGAGCNNVIEMMAPGTVERVAPDGQVLSVRCARHMAEHRMRCPDCGINFCNSCMEQPYHVGLTCNANRERKAARPCRFCSVPLPPTTGKSVVCKSEDCKAALASACEVKHMQCNHWCCGVFGESKCMPCIECNKEADDFCNICWTDALRASAVIRLKCDHAFHLACVKTRLQKRWPTARISFNFAKCPLCREWVDHPQVAGLMKGVLSLKKKVEASAVERLKLEGGDKDAAVLAKHNGNLADVALSRYNYYHCVKCNRYCCQVASFFCFGHTHFCEGCHKKWVQGAFKAPQTLVTACKCSVKHAPNGLTQASEACFGCSLCRIKVVDNAPI